MVDLDRTVVVVEESRMVEAGESPVAVDLNDVGLALLQDVGIDGTVTTVGKD
jgi:hypothetical protein